MASKKMTANATNGQKPHLDEKRLGIALGAGTALSIGLMGLSVGSLRNMMGIGYGYNGYGMMGSGLPVAGLVTAMVWGFVIGGLTGYVTAWVYNRA